MDPRSLNENQMVVYRRIESHYATLLATNPDSVDPLRLIVLGTAGTRKSYLIKMIQDRLCELARHHDVNVSLLCCSPILMLPPTFTAQLSILPFLFPCLAKVLN